MILWKIAWRNLREHKTKTLIIGILVALGVSLVVIGNSVLESITKGMEASYVENFTGDLIIRNTSEERVNFIGFGGSPPVITNFTDLMASLDKKKDISKYTSLLTGMASVNKNNKTLSFVLLWGIQPSSYFEMFPNKFVITSGEVLKDNEIGIMLSQRVVDEAFEEYGIELQVGDNILLSGQNNTTGTKIRELEIIGIGYYENTAGLLERISLVDANTLRSLTGLTAVKVDKSNDLAAPDTSEDGLFGSSDSLFGDSLVTEPEASNNATDIDFDSVLGDTSVRDEFLTLDNNAWHFILLDTNSSIENITESLDNDVGSSLILENWRWGAGFLAELAFSIRTILNIVILVISIVAIIIIMNTLVISVTERTGEIGTIRAIGGQKSFVRRMITIEVLTIILIFGIIGIILGSLFVAGLNFLGLPATNLFLEILYGGSTLRPTLSISSLYLSIIAIAVIGVIASLYPTSVALGVSPVQAMQKN